MLRARIYFTQEIPGWGDSIRVDEDVADVRRLMRVALLNEDATAEFTRHGRAVLLPTRLIGLVNQS